MGQIVGRLDERILCLLEIFEIDTGQSKKIAIFGCGEEGLEECVGLLGLIRSVVAGGQHISVVVVVAECQ